ncbi:Sacchrp-dh-NADP domain-containing protein [Favolaschia claudopus]|uniref:Sacchrp-dh-NADP domain-containing protein n=1 Tax=Favolaschia claudopus TaxID=2862362 RepID=A0AAW0E4M5_9AGAR
MAKKPTILILGATGFTGKLISHYLAGHRDGALFNLALGARSKARLDAVVAALDIGTSVELHVVDTTQEEQLEAILAKKEVTVVINTVGPFYLWGTPVVKACVKHGVHYVDLTGEPHWVKRIITTYHYAASKTGAIIIPASGLDSMPADLVPYIACKTLRSHNSDQHVGIDTSLSAYSIRGGFSGGTINTGITMLEQVQKEELRVAGLDYSLSPCVGKPPPRRPLIYRLFVPDIRKTIIGATYFMAHPDRSVVQRSWGLLELEAAENKSQIHYGPAFQYDEFMVTGGTVRAVILTVGMAIGLGAMLVAPLRWLIKKVLPKSGDGPSESVRNNGYLKITNITTAVPSSGASPLQVKTVLTGKGDPGYKLTSVLISEAALALALNDRNALPAIGRRGGVLTPATALGDVLIDRLTASGQVTISSEIISVRSPEGKKTV